MVTTPRVILLMAPYAGYERAVLRGIARYARLHGPWVFHLSGDDPGLPLPRTESLLGLPAEFHALGGGRRRANLPDLKKWDATGFIGRVQTAEAAHALLASGLPAIALDLSAEQLAAGHPLAQLSELCPDSQKSGRLAAEHLLERGFRHFAFCGYAGRIWSQRREEGFGQRLAEAGFPCRVYDPPRPAARRSWQQEHPAVSRWLQALPKPVGVMACNDVRGRQLIEACGLCGLRVPDDVAVVGVDEDRLFCELSNPTLSSVAFNAEQGGYRAAELLDGLMSDRVCPPQRILVEPLWVVPRRSTDVIAVDDPDVATALRFIRDNARRPIGVGDVVRQAAMARRTLEIRFQRLLGRSIHAEIQRVRLGWTKQLLLETELPLWKIAEHSGMNGQSYLSKVFRRETGMTMAQYRRQHRAP